MDKTLDKTPLRSPGQGLREYLHEADEHAVTLFAYTAGICFGIILFYGLAHVVPMVLNPWVAIPIPLIAFAIVTVRIVRTLQRLRSYRLGLRGEQLVGETLTHGLSNAETFIFHDISFDAHNVDHLIISTKGVMAIETKAVYNDTATEEQKTIVVAGDSVIIGGYRNTEHLQQALRNAESIRLLLVKLGFDSIQVEAGLIYPGRWVESVHPQVLVRNAGAFCTSFAKRSPRIDIRTVQQLREALDRHVRGTLSSQW